MPATSKHHSFQTPSLLRLTGIRMAPLTTTPSSLFFYAQEADLLAPPVHFPLPDTSPSPFLPVPWYILVSLLGSQLSIVSTLSNILPSKSFWPLHSITQAITFTREQQSSQSNRWPQQKKAPSKCRAVLLQSPSFLLSWQMRCFYFLLLCRQITFQITPERLIIMNQPNSVFTAMFFIILELNIGLVTNL